MFCNIGIPPVVGITCRSRVPLFYCSYHVLQMQPIIIFSSFCHPSTFWDLCVSGSKSYISKAHMSSRVYAQTKLIFGINVAGEFTNFLTYSSFCLDHETFGFFQKLINKITFLRVNVLLTLLEVSMETIFQHALLPK